MVLVPNSATSFVRDARAAGDRTPIYTMSYTPPSSLVNKVGVERAVGVGAGVKVLQISRFENAHGSSRRATDAWFDVGQGFTSLSPLVAGIAARTAPAAEEIPAELDQEPRGGRQVIL